MSAPCETTMRQASGGSMSVFERYLTVWVLLYIVAVIGLGSILPGPFQLVGSLELAQVNI